MARKARTRYYYPSKADQGKGRLDNSQERVRSARLMVAKMLVDGTYSRKDIVDALMEKYDYSESMAGEYYAKGMKNMERRYNQLCLDAARVNYMRLDNIIDEEMEKGNNKGAVDAIDKQNKMVGAYQQNINVSTDKPVFEIKIGD